MGGRETEGGRHGRKGREECGERGSRWRGLRMQDFGLRYQGGGCPSEGS